MRAESGFDCRQFLRRFHFYREQAMMCMQMNFKYMQAALCVLLASVFAASAEEMEPPAAAQVLALADAVNLALENNLDIRRSENSVGLLKTKDKYSWNSVSPSINLNGSFADNFEAGTTSFSLSGSLGISLSPNLYASIRGARLNYEQGLISYGQTVRTVELNVRKAFYGLLYEQENIALQKRSLATSEAQYRQNQEKFRRGQIPELDVMTSRVSYEQKKPAVEAAETAFLNDLASFKQIIGMNQQTDVSLSGSLDDVLNVRKIELPPADKPAPNVQLAEKSVEIAQNGLLSSRFGSYAPSLSLGYQYGKTYGNSMSADYDWATVNSLSVGVQIPLDGWLPWSAGAVYVASAKTNVADAQLQLENAMETTAVQTESCMRKITQAISQVDSLRSTVELAERTYSMTETAYNYGKTDLMGLLNASDSVLSASVSLKQQAYTLVSAILDLESLLGVPFGTIGIPQAEAERAE